MGHTDNELIAAANAGDSEAFAELYQRHRQWVANLAMRFTGHQDDALDVLQEAFLYLLGKFPGFVLSCELRTFLYPTVRHLAWRKRERRGVVDTELLLQWPAATSEQPGEGVASAVACLPPGQREVLMLRFVDGFTLEEIATALAIPLGTVKSRLHHALDQLRADPACKNFLLQ